MGNNLMQTDLSVWGMYQHADIVVKCVMIGLILASVVTWAIFFSKSLEFFTFPSGVCISTPISWLSA